MRDRQSPFHAAAVRLSKNEVKEILKRKQQEKTNVGSKITSD